MDILLGFGGEVKALSEGVIGGYLVKFSGTTDPDLDGDYFTKSTDFDLLRSDQTTIYYNHGLDMTLKQQKLGVGTMKVDEVGVWLEAQLDIRNKYTAAVLSLVKAGKLGWSSGTATHLVERKQIGAANEVIRWPLGLDASLTPTPAEPRTHVVALKSYESEVLPLDLPTQEEKLGLDYFKSIQHSLESGVSLEDHALRVESATEHLCDCLKLVTEMNENLFERFSSRNQVRIKANRQLSKSNRDRLSAAMQQVHLLKTQMETLHASLDAIIAVNDAGYVLAESERLAMENDLLRSEAREAGIL